MGYCNGLCPYLDNEKHKCRQTGEKLGYIKGWWGTTHEHRGFCERDEENVERSNEHEVCIDAGTSERR